MRFTATLRGHVEIEAQSSAHRGVLTPDDYEAFLDALNDSLYLQEVDDVTIGGSLTKGDIEVSFSVEANVLAEAHQRSIEVINIANVAAISAMAQRLSGTEPVMAPHWTESQVSELVGA